MAKARGLPDTFKLNVSQAAINLRGAKLSGSIRFQFSTYSDTLLAPGQKLVIVKDLFRFRQRYGVDVQVAGIYGGKFKTGERLTILPADTPQP